MLEILSLNKPQTNWETSHVPVNSYHLSHYLLLLQFLRGIYANSEKKSSVYQIYSETDIFWYWTYTSVRGLNGCRVGWKAFSWERKSNEETIWELKNKQSKCCKCKGHYNNALIFWVKVANFLEVKLESVENQCSTLQWMLGQALWSQMWHLKVNMKGNFPSEKISAKINSLSLFFFMDICERNNIFIVSSHWKYHHLTQRPVRKKKKNSRCWWVCQQLKQPASVSLPLQVVFCILLWCQYALKLILVLTLTCTKLMIIQGSGLPAKWSPA